MKKLSKWAMTAASSVCMVAALSIFGQICRFWLYDEPIPKALQALDQ